LLFSYKPKELSYAERVEPPKDNGIAVGFDKGTYETEHRSSYKNRGLENARCQVDIVAKSKADHVEIGIGSEDHITVYQDEYRRDQENKSKLFHKDNGM
jgi:hypothetical protein